jgi:flagellin
VNLLAGNETTTITTTITRDNGSFELSTFTLQGQNLDNLELAGVATGVYDGSIGGGTAQQDAEQQFDALTRAFNSGFGDRLDADGNGDVEFGAGGVLGADDRRTLEGVADPADNTFQFYGTEDDRNFLASIGIATTNEGKIGDDTTKDVIQITDKTAAPDQALVDAFYADGQAGAYDFDGVTGYTAGDQRVAFDYVTGKEAGAVAAAFANGSGVYDSAGDQFFQEAVFGDTQLRTFANDSGFRAVARQVNVNDPVNGNVQAGFVLADSMIARINIAATVVGVFESTLSSRQNFLSDLTDSLELGVAALTEADLNEESSKLQSYQVQEQLAVQALSIANQRPQTLLSLFR